MLSPCAMMLAREDAVATRLFYFPDFSHCFLHVLFERRNPHHRASKACNGLQNQDLEVAPFQVGSSADPGVPGTQNHRNDLTPLGRLLIGGRSTGHSCIGPLLHRATPASSRLVTIPTPRNDRKANLAPLDKASSAMDSDGSCCVHHPKSCSFRSIWDHH